MRGADRLLVERIRLRWTREVSAGAVVDEIVRLALDARREGCELHLEEASGVLLVLLRICGLAAPGGPVVVCSGSERVRQVEGGEQ